MSPLRLLAATLAAALTGGAALAEEVVNVYSARHYDTDERLYTDFEAQTGIRVVRIEGGADELIARMTAEGEASPADVFIAVDAGRMWRAEEAGLLAPLESAYLDERIPEHLRHPEGRWFAFSRRARIIFYDKNVVANPPQTYEELADPRYRGMICTRSSSNVYMLSLLASIIAHDGVDDAAAWVEGVWANRARDPQGGDTDQLRGVVSGECPIALANSYYFIRALRTDVDGVSEGVDRIGWVFPNQGDRGAHINVSAAGMAAHAPNPENAKLFLEYLASESAQVYFSAGNDEYPAVPGVEVSPSVQRLGEFAPDTLPLEKLGENQPLAQALYDTVGYE